MKKIILLFIASVLLTAIFSYSLKIFLKEGFVVFTLKTMFIPCFTWSILMLSAFFTLKGAQRLQYFTVAGWVCMIGSAVLVPAGIYNFIAAAPDLYISVASVFLCVIVMSILFYVLLNKANISLRWWIAFNVLICINMTLFWLSAKK